MSTTRKKSWWMTCIGLVAAVAFPRAAAAHRLDEFLQATRISIAPDAILLEIDLTPGAEIGPMVFALINTDRDGRISSAEGRAYANHAVRDMILELDGRPKLLAVERTRFPSFEEMRAGTGTVRIEARAAAVLSPGRHTLRYQNSDRPDGSVYLVNALVPSSPKIEITDQHRDPLQREIRLGFNVTSGSTVSIVLPLLVIVGLGFLIPIGYGYRRKQNRHRTLRSTGLDIL